MVKPRVIGACAIAMGAMPRWRALVVAAIVSSGCAVAPAPETVTVHEEDHVARPWQAVCGGWAAAAQGRPAGPSERVQFRFPAGVAVRGDDVVVVDSGLAQALRYDRSRDTVAQIVGLDGAQGSAPIAIALGADGSLYLADATAGVVRRVDRSGRVLNTYRDAQLERPIGVAVDDARRRLFVADGRRQHVVAFDLSGAPRGVLGSRERIPFQDIAAIAVGPDGLYVLDRAAQQVVVLDSAGGARKVLADDGLIEPVALAVDRARRVFVVDDADQTITMYVDEAPSGRFGGRGSAPGHFRHITSLAVDDGLLYVSDGERACVQIVLLTPEEMRHTGVH